MNIVVLDSGFYWLSTLEDIISNEETKDFYF